MTDTSETTADDLWALGQGMIYSTPPAQQQLNPDTDAMLAQLKANRLVSNPAGLVDQVAGAIQTNLCTLYVGAHQAVCVASMENRDATAEDWWLLQLVLTVESDKGYQWHSGSQQGPYLKGLAVAVTPSAPAASVVSTYDSVPHTPVGETQESDEISGSLSGTIGMDGLGGTGGVTGDIGFSHTVSQTIADITIDNNSNGVVAWTGAVNLTEKAGHFSGGGYSKGLPTPPDVAVHTFRQEFAWVWQYPYSARSGNSFALQADVDLTYEYAWIEMVGMQLEASCHISVPQIAANYPPLPVQAGT